MDNFGNLFGSAFSSASSYGTGMGLYNTTLTGSYTPYSSSYLSTGMFSSCPTCGGSSYSYSSMSPLSYKLF